jgi:hypothetical protein
MKKLNGIIAGLCVLLTMAACKNGTSIVHSSGDDYMEINYTGQIKFTEDETAIESITPDGFLKYRNNNKRLAAKSNYHGVIDYKLYKANEQIDANSAEGKQFLAQAIREILTDGGFDAKGRLERIYKKGGYRAVLNEADNIKNEHIKGMYLEYALSNGAITASELSELIKRIDTVLSADYEKVNLYKKLMVADSFAATNVDVMLDAIKQLNADYDKVNLLKQLSDAVLPDGASFNKLLGIVGALNADYEKAGMLTCIISNNITSTDQWMAIISQAAKIKSGIDKTNVLLAIAKKMPANQTVKETYMLAAKTITSDLDYARVMKAAE